MAEPAHVAELRPEQIDQAFPLAREFRQGLSIEDWRRYAASVITPPLSASALTGIMAAFSENPAYLRGFWAYHIQSDLRAGRQLVIDFVAVPETIGGLEVARRLLRASTWLADAQGCTRVLLHLQERARWLSTPLGEAGFAPEPQSLWYRPTSPPK
jgi:hypothetical protein